MDYVNLDDSLTEEKKEKEKKRFIKIRNLLSTRINQIQFKTRVKIYSYCFLLLARRQ